MILLIAVHGVVGRFGDGEHVWRDFQTVLVSVGVEDLRSVDAEISEWVDGDQYVSDVCLIPYEFEV